MQFPGRQRRPPAPPFRPAPPLRAGRFPPPGNGPPNRFREHVAGRLTPPAGCGEVVQVSEPEGGAGEGEPEGVLGAEHQSDGTGRQREARAG
jgi:hypothetical protein